MKTLDQLIMQDNKDLKYYAPIIKKFIKKRKELNLSQNQLAKNINVSSSTISRIENFAIKPTFELLSKIAKYLELEISISDNYFSNTDCIEQTYDLYNKNYQKNSEMNCGNSTDLTTEWINSIYSNNYKKTFLSIAKEINNNLTFFCNQNCDYISFLNNNLNKYIDILKKYSVNILLVDNVKKFKRIINIVIDQYYLGHHELSYTIFSECLDELININCFISDINNDLIFYRGREKIKNEYFNADDMFHIPYNKRFLVSTQRYSFPGLPCLYLGASKEVCDIELGNKENVYATIEYKNDDNRTYKLFDLTNIFQKNINDMCNHEMGLFLIEFPLIFVCSTKINYKVNVDKIKFKTEYIIPQLLLEYILKKTALDNNIIIGLKYYSNRINFFNSWVNNETKTLFNMCNYVFPARSKLKKEGYCDFLRNKFIVTHIDNNTLIET